MDKIRGRAAGKELEGRGGAVGSGEPALRLVMAYMSSRTLSYSYKALMVCAGLSYQRRLPSSIDFLMSSTVIHLVS